MRRKFSASLYSIPHSPILPRIIYKTHDPDLYTYTHTEISEYLSLHSHITFLKIVTRAEPFKPNVLTLPGEALSSPAPPSLFFLLLFFFHVSLTRIGKTSTIRKPAGVRRFWTIYRDSGDIFQLLRQQPQRLSSLPNRRQSRFPSVAAIAPIIIRIYERDEKARARARSIQCHRWDSFSLLGKHPIDLRA